MDRKYSIKDLVEIDRLHTLFETFSKATGFAIGFLSYPEQELLIAVGWQEICENFHRACPVSAKCCKNSDACLTSTPTHLKDLSIQLCDNGLVDGATPLFIRGEHIASIATGQVLLNPPDLKFFKRRAARYGYDMEAYLAALAKVPIVSEEQLKSVLAFLAELAVQIAEEGLRRLQDKEKTEALRESKQVVEEEVRERTAELRTANATISKSEASLRALSNNIPNGITYQLRYTADGDSRIEYVSSGIERIYGFSTKTALNDIRTIYSALHPEDAARLIQEGKDAALNLRVCNTVGRVITPKGDIRWIHWRSTPRRMENGDVVTDGIAIDITEQKKAEEALIRANRTLEVLKECDKALVRATSESELLDQVCRILMDIWGAQMTWVGLAEDDEKKSVRVAAFGGDDTDYIDQLNVTWADEPRGRGPTGMAIRTGQVQISRDILNDPYFDPWHQAAMQRNFKSAVSIPLIAENRSIGVLVLYSTHLDSFNEEEIELLQQLANDLTYGIISLRTSEERRHLQDALLTISEREKQHIAQELHDGICQHLAGTAMTSKLMEKRLSQKDAEEAVYARQICELLTTGMQEVRNLSHGLHPVKNDPAGLMDALGQLAQNVTKLFCIPCTFCCELPVTLDDSLAATHLFRIAQESVNNAMKHGEASRITIELARDRDGIHLSITDNGVGISKKAASTGMGMQIMKHRASVIGAALKVRKAGKHGTVVHCHLPSSCSCLPS